MAGKRHDEQGIFFGSFQNDLAFIKKDKPYEKYDNTELQEYFSGFFDYICSHYSYLYIPVETDAHTYTKLETSDMQKLMDKNIHAEIEKVITKDNLKQINTDLNKFVKDIEKTLESYEYKGISKNSLTMPDLISKIIEAYFSIKILNKKVSHSKSVPVYNMSSGEKRKALIDVAYSFLVRNTERDRKIILAIDEPDASLHMSACYKQFSRLYELSEFGHQILITTHWYGYLPIISKGSAASIKKTEDNEVKVGFFNLYNYREQISQERKNTRDPLPYDISIKSYNDLVQSITYSLMELPIHNWIICEGISEKIYFEHLFSDIIISHNLKILPVGGYKEVKRIYENLLGPIHDSDYEVKGVVYCLIDTDTERLETNTKTSSNLYFKRLLNKEKEGTVLLDVGHVATTPPTEIEDCLDPNIYYKTLLFFKEQDKDIDQLLKDNVQNPDAKNSFEVLDIKKSEQKILKGFFDKDFGGNKVAFAKKYVEFSKSEEFKASPDLKWIKYIKSLIIDNTKKKASKELNVTKASPAKEIKPATKPKIKEEKVAVLKEKEDFFDEPTWDNIEEIIIEEVSEDIDEIDSGLEDNF